MATSKQSKKRPLSLSLSQPSGLGSSRSWRKKNISSQDCDISDGNSKTLRTISEEEDNPRRKLVEEWLEKNNADICSGGNIDSADEHSQETVLLEGNCHSNFGNQNKGRTGPVVEDVVVVEHDIEDVMEKNVVKNNTVKQDVANGTLVKPEIIIDDAKKEENIVKQELVKELVIGGAVEHEAGTSSEPSAEEDPLLQCPLCWKNFEKPHTQAAHLKACAAANGLTTRQLIDAVDLHKKQLAERKKLGLFPMAAPSAAPKKSAPRKAEGQTTRKGRQPKDSNLELALALSLSLAQGEDRQESLNAFGFTSKTVGPKKSAPVLLTRTQAERERLITEKVAIVLMDEPEGSQPSNNSQDTCPALQSAQLQEWCMEDHPLWKRSHSSPSKSDSKAFYVSALGNVIVPSKTEVGANLRHLSQLPFRMNTPKKNKLEERPANSSVNKVHNATNTSLTKLEQDVKVKHLSDWASMLKNTSMSDVTIYVRGGIAIPAHKLVLGVRCPPVLRDVTKQQNQVTGLHVDVVLWPDTSNDVATSFLEYIYYGSIRSIHTLRKDTSGLRWLANRYEANDLIEVLSYFDEKKRAVKSLADVRSLTPDPAPLNVPSVTSARSLETMPVEEDGSLKSSEEKESVDIFLDEEENLSIHSRKTEERKEPPESDHSLHSQRTERKESPSNSVHSLKTVIPVNKCESPDMFSDKYDFALSPSPESETRGENTATKKLSFDSLNLDSDALAQIDGLSTGSLTKPESSSPRGKCSRQWTPPKKISVASKNSASPQSEKSIDPSKQLVGTPKKQSSPNVVDVSPCSASPSLQPPSGSQSFVDLQRPASPDDDDIFIISDDEEPKKVVTETQKRRDLLSIDGEEEQNIAKSQKPRDLLSMSTDDEEENSITKSQKPRDFLAMSTDDESEKNVTERRKPRGVLSVSTESLKPGKSQSPDRNSPYISPVWNGFEDMPCDFDMGLNWNDEPIEVHNSPVRENRDESPVHELGTSPVRRSFQRASSVCGRYLDTSPVRRRGIDTSPAGSIQDLSPVRKSIRSSSFAHEKELDTSPARRRGLDTVRDNRDTSLVHRQYKGISPVRGKYQGISPVRNNRVHDISESGSSDEELARGNEGNVAKDMLNDSMNAILASSHLDQLLERRTPKRAGKNKDDSGSESGRVTPMKDYRGMTTPEVKVELQKYGMKPNLGKRKGVIMLEYIYNQLHPFVPDDEIEPQNLPTAAQPSSQTASNRASTVRARDSSSSSSSSSSSAEGLSDVEVDDSDSGTVLSQRGTKMLSAAELPDIVTKHIEKDRVLHRKILEYEPVFVEHFHSDLKANGYRCKVADLMAYFGEKCINYRSVKMPGSRTRKKNDQNGNARKKRRPDPDLDLDLPNSNGRFI